MQINLKLRANFQKSQEIALKYDSFIEQWIKNIFENENLLICDAYKLLEKAMVFQAAVSFKEF